MTMSNKTGGKKEKMEKALRMYEKKLQYTKEYQKKRYEKVSVVVRKIDVDFYVKSKGWDRNIAKKYVAYQKLESELKKKKIIGVGSGSVSGSGSDNKT